MSSDFVTDDSGDDISGGFEHGAIAPRLEYGSRSLELGCSHPDPVELFGRWLKEAVAAGVREANALCLCTADELGPDGRMLLLKDYGERGFSFFTNYESRKGQQLAASPRASMVFWWSILARQVRLRGPVERLSAYDSDRYFHTRPRQSQLGAWASHQSRAVKSRKAIESAFAEQSKVFCGDVPRPPYWGGYILRPLAIEFWQGRDNRLHDRFLYQRDSFETDWKAERLMP